ncbi:MAG: hypothetical protein O3C40_24445 [Planctomycetota bacterium]|nr:hypothetical protein [Planctomycetota bacterium]
MNYKKRIVCLANSRKMSGRCVAGLEIDGEDFGEWIRPVSSRSTQEISLEERRFEDGSELDLLDIVDVPMLKPTPHAYQSENHLIDADYYWTKVGTFSNDRVQELCEEVESLWTNGHNSYDGINDRITEDEAHRTIDSSLVLIRPDNITILVQQGYKKREVRAQFEHRSEVYRMRVTDPDFEREVLRQPDG